MNQPIAAKERQDLSYYTDANAILLISDEGLAEVHSDEGIHKDEAYYAISLLAGNLALVGDEVGAEKLANHLLQCIDASDEGKLQTWKGMVETGAKSSIDKLRAAIGVTYDNNEPVLGEAVDAHDADTFMGLLYLYKLGDTQLLPYLHQYIEGLDGEDVRYGTSAAIKLFEAGDKSAYGLVVSCATKTRDYALAQETKEEINADDASDVQQIIKGMAAALAPIRAASEQFSAPSDLRLRYFAESLLKEGYVKRAEEIQSLILSGFDNAWLSARRFELGCDPTGNYAAAAQAYTGIYGPEMGSHALEILNSLVRGGNPEMVATYQAIYEPTVTWENMDPSIAASMLTALYLSGDTRARDRLLELVKSPIKQIIALEEMGLKDEALALARKEFIKDRNYNTALALLNLNYDADAMLVVQRGVATYHGSVLRVVSSHARHLGRLVDHIKQLES